MTKFKEWCVQHVPEWYSAHKDELVVHDNVVSLSTYGAMRFTEQHRRPAHHIGLPLAKLGKDVTILPSALHSFAQYMPQVELTAQGAWMVSCAKDVLFESVTSDLPTEGTIILLRHGPFIAGMGQVLKQTGAPQDRVVKRLCDVGAFLKL